MGAAKANIQLWSCHYTPEPTGNAPVSEALARGLAGRGWNVEVVAAHPHYPRPIWERSRLPRRETRDGVQVLRVPLWVGRRSAAARIRQEISFTLALLGLTPWLGRPLLAPPDLILAASPSFPALMPAMLSARLRRIPFVPWLHDILPDGAVVTGLLDERSLSVRASRRLERAAYSAAERIVVLSAAFRDNLVEKGVPAEKITLVYDPATRGIPARPPRRRLDGRPRVLSIGNIGLSQGLAPLVRAFEASDIDAELTITGEGVAAPSLRDEVVTDRVDMPGLVDDARLERELAGADLALVSQNYEGTQFNLPSKLMNFMAQGLPIIAAVSPASEVAQLVNEAGAGWVVDSSRPERFPEAISRAVADPVELERRGAAGHAYALRRFSSRTFIDGFESLLVELLGRDQAATRAASLS